MDKILSARVDESVLHKISLLAYKLRVSKKKIIEGAIHLYSQKMESDALVDVFEQSHGAWKRKESLQQTAQKARAAFKKSMERSRS